VERRADRPLGVAVLVGAAGVAAAGYVAIADPGRAGRLPTAPCPFHALTGWWCPGCGMTRAAHDVLTGHPMAALGTNLLWPLVAVVAGWLAAAWLWPQVPSPTKAPAGLWVALIALAVAYGIARNTAVFSALAP
jgi:hypothetical protein